MQDSGGLFDQFLQNTTISMVELYTADGVLVETPSNQNDFNNGITGEALGGTSYESVWLDAARHCRTARNKVIPLSRKKSVNLLAALRRWETARTARHSPPQTKKKCLHLMNNTG